MRLNSWYLDDGTLVGSPDQLAAALDIIETLGPAIGLNLNRNKSLLFIPEEEDATSSPLPTDIPVTRQGFSLLGCPIGPPEFCEEAFHNRVSKVKASLGCLHDLEDSQLEVTLLRSCLSLPKVSHILRCCPPPYLIQAAEGLDSAMRETLEVITGAPVTDWSWLKAPPKQPWRSKPPQCGAACSCCICRLPAQLPAAHRGDARLQPQYAATSE